MEPTAPLLPPQRAPYSRRTIPGIETLQARSVALQALDEKLDEKTLEALRCKFTALKTGCCLFTCGGDTFVYRPLPPDTIQY